MKIKILDRYILGKFLSAFLFVVLMLTIVICIIDLTEKNDDFIRTKPGLYKILVQYYLNFIPYYANLLSPITVFIATVFVTARLAARTEITAILCSGVSFVRFLMPYIAGASIIGLAIFYLNGNVIPVSNRKRIAFEIEFIKKGVNFDQHNVHMKISPTSYAYLESYSNAANTGYLFTLEEIEKGQLNSKIKADRIVWLPEKKQWRLENWTYRTIASDGQSTIKLGATKDTTLRLTPGDFDANYLFYEMLTNSELNTFIQEQEKRGSDTVMDYKIERYLRFTAPFAIVILTVIGVIVSARKSREGAGFQIALGFLLAFVYIIFFIMSRSVAQRGGIDPLLACWMPNLIFTGIGLVLYRYVPR